MSIVPIFDRASIRPLFLDATDTTVWAYFESNMGTAYGDGATPPRSAVIVCGDICFFGGEPNAALARFLPRVNTGDVIILVPPDEAWEALIEAAHGARAMKTIRYATKKEADTFDRDKLAALAANVDPAFSMCPVDRALYGALLSEAWSENFVYNFLDCDDYLARGIGFAALYQGKPVACASSYSVYNGGIEVGVGTRPDFQRRGLALAVSAKLVLTCLERGLYPSWDARIPASLALSERLGYHLEREYVAYEVTLPRSSPRIRPMTEADWPGVAAVFTEGIEEGNATFRTECPDYAGWNAEHLPCCRLVAEKDGDILGFAALTPMSKRACYRGVAEISVYIGSRAQGQGLGTALLEALIRDSERAGIWTLFSVIFSGNENSIRLHEACGFRYVGREERRAKDKFGAWRDTVVYERRSAAVGVD